ncbi:similar to An15g07820 [Aspergillus luchuensis]|uniref:Similar to An15g07820 n=1 Tax=Aspergillus kawachii TaxID=1069201 RepID=A0A146F4X7_ASPKA|nr:similar to An15g07820 [Aspergillus luchuensis]
MACQPILQQLSVTSTPGACEERQRATVSAHAFQYCWYLDFELSLLMKLFCGEGRMPLHIRVEAN